MSDQPTTADLMAILTAINSKQDSLRIDLDGLRMKVDGLRTDLMARMDRLQTRIDQLRDEAFVTFAHRENLRTRIDRTGAEQRGLTEELSAIIRSMHTLSSRVDALERRA